jgi:hypothetical protein
VINDEFDKKGNGSIPATVIGGGWNHLMPEVTTNQNW